MQMYMETIINKGYKDINPVQFGFEACECSHSYGPALRTYWLLHYVVSGKGYFRIEDREYSVTAGSIFVIPPFVETYYEADSITPWEYIWIGFDMSNDIEVGFDDVMYLPATQCIFEDMKQCSTKVSGKTEFLCSKIWQLISYILDKNEDRVDYIKQAISLINSEYMTGLTVQNIADRLGLERTYFSDYFKRQVGESPKRYLLRTRMERAADLLKNYGYSVTVTALSVGYGDVYTFSKMFRRYFGVSPSHYE